MDFSDVENSEEEQTLGEKLFQIAVDLVWLREREIGGIESFTRNLLDGMAATKESFDVILLTSSDNTESFRHYEADPRFKVVPCDIDSHDVKRRVLWQNFKLAKIVRKLGLSCCYVPYYCKPILWTPGVKFCITVHDLQALHYPEYFSFGKRLWYKIGWAGAIPSAAHIVASSDFVKQDVLSHYRVKANAIERIYIPIIINQKELIPISEIEEKYGIKAGNYYFTVASLLPHKNVITLIKAMNLIKKRKLPLPDKLIVSGVGGSTRNALCQLIADEGLQGNVMLTSFIENAERNTLYKNCRAFLMPSLFEGFGMPPVEAVKLGAPVISTKKASLYEVTQGKVTYVDNPLDAEEWIEKMLQDPKPVTDFDFSVYEQENTTMQYMRVFSKLSKDTSSI